MDQSNFPEQLPQSPEQETQPQEGLEANIQLIRSKLLRLVLILEDDNIRINIP